MTQARSPFDMLGGETVVGAIVNRFYDLMEHDTAYAELRALHAADLTTVRHGLTLFLNAWLGGPKDWFERGFCVMSLHRRFPIDPTVADQWADAMARAIAAQPGLDKTLAQAMAERLGHMAHAMVNQMAPDQQAQDAA